MVTPWIEIFRAGTHTDMSGKRKKYSATDLDRIIQKTDTKALTVPAVIGHPKTNAPAYGWVSALRRKGRSLYARFSQVDKKFWAAVKAGRYKKRSVALSKSGAIVHVGWLGAAPPAVAGMKDLFLKKGKGKVAHVFTLPKGGEKMKIKKRHAKAVRRIKKLEAQLKKADKKASSYAAYMAPKASRKRVKARKKRVRGLVEDRKITPAAQGAVLAYATVLSRDVTKVRMGGEKKRTLEDHFLRGLEKGEDDPIFRSFALSDADAIDINTGEGEGSLAKEIAGHVIDMEEEDEK